MSKELHINAKLTREGFIVRLFVGLFIETGSNYEDQDGLGITVYTGWP